MATTIDDFLSQYQSSTRINYEQVIYEAQYHMRKPIEMVMHQDIVKYQRAIEHQAPATVRRKLAVLQTLIRYFNDIDLRADNPMKGIKRPKVDAYKSIKWLTDDEIGALLNEARSDKRSLALVWLALHGLRVAEIVGLNVEQFQDGILWNVVGKGGKTRNVPLSDDARTAVTAYVGTRSAGPLFRGTQGRLGVRRIQGLIYSLTAAIGREVSIHALRHTYATRAVRRGVQTLILAKLMGHESPNTTQKYVNLNVEDLRPANEMVYPSSKGLRVLKKEEEAI